MNNIEGIKKEDNPKIKNNLEKAKDLTKFCLENGNPLSFIDYGENFDLDNFKINPEILIKINEEQSKLAVFCLKFSKTYLNGPIFLDTFSKNHGKRREWEEKIETLMDEEILKYYNSNRLSVNNYGNVINFFNLFLNKITDPEIKNKLLNIKNLIPKELTSVDNESNLVYGSLEDNRKVEIIKEFSQITREIISNLEK